MRSFSIFFRKKNHAGTAVPFTSPEPNKMPDWLRPLIQDVRDWEAPDGDQLEHSFMGYQADLDAPIEKLDKELADKTMEGREVVQRCIEIAPDLFEKVLRRYPNGTGYHIEGDKK